MGKRLISPQTAKEWLEIYNVANYRPLSEDRAEKFSRDMRQGNWRYIPGQTIKFDVNGQLLDGQHRLRALIVSDTSQPFNIENGYDPDDKYYLDLGKARLLGNMLNDIGFKDSNNVGASIRLGFDVEVFRQGRNPNTGSNQATFHEVIDYAKAHEDELTFAVGSTYTVPTALMRRSVAVYIYRTLHSIDPYACAEFFHKLVEVEGIDDVVDKPIRQLHKRLVYGHWMAKGKTLRLQIVATIFRAWNAWRNQEQLGHLQVSSNDIKKLTMVEPV